MEIKKKIILKRIHCSLPPEIGLELGLLVLRESKEASRQTAHKNESARKKSGLQLPGQANGALALWQFENFKKEGQLPG